MPHDQARGIHAFVAGCRLDLLTFLLPGAAPCTAAPITFDGTTCRLLKPSTPGRFPQEVLFLLMLLLLVFFDAASLEFI